MPFLSLSFSGFSILVDFTVITGPSDELGVIPFLTILHFFSVTVKSWLTGVEGGAGMQHFSQTCCLAPSSGFKVPTLAFLTEYTEFSWSMSCLVCMFSVKWILQWDGNYSLCSVNSDFNWYV